MGCGLSAPVSDGTLKSNDIDKQLREAGKDYDKEVKRFLYIISLICIKKIELVLLINVVYG